MKKAKKAIFASEACLLAMAAFGCVYGPPPDEDVMTPPSTTTLESEIPTEETADTTEKNTEKAAAESEESSENSETAMPTAPTYNPEEDTFVALYAPPEFWD